MAATTLATIGLVTSVVGTVGGLAMQAKANSAQRKAIQEQQKGEQARYRMEQRQAIRRAQIQRAQMIASAGAAGATDTSGLSGGISSIGSQLGSGLGYASMQSAIGANIAQYQTQAARATGMGQMFSGLAGLGGSLFDAGGGWQTLRGNQGQQQPRVDSFIRT